MAGAFKSVCDIISRNGFTSFPASFSWKLAALQGVLAPSDELRGVFQKIGHVLKKARTGQEMEKT